MSTLSGRVIVRFEPLACFAQTFLDRSKLELRVELAKLGVGSSLLELAVTLRGVEHNVTLEIHSFYSTERKGIHNI